MLVSNTGTFIFIFFLRLLDNEEYEKMKWRAIGSLNQ